MTGMESQIFTAQRLHGTHLTPRHIIIRGDITHRSVPGQTENEVGSSDFHGFEQLEKFGEQSGRQLQLPEQSGRQLQLPRQEQSEQFRI